MFSISVCLHLPDGVPQLKKLSRINPETQAQGEALRSDGWSEEGREEWMIDNQDQRAPEDSGVVLQPISEDDSSIFSSSGQSSDYLQPTRYLGENDPHLKFQVFGPHALDPDVLYL